jgi:hypothetical protein
VRRNRYCPKFIQKGIRIMMKLTNTRWIAGLLTVMVVGLSARADAAANNGKTVSVVNVNLNNGQAQLAVALSDGTAYVANVGTGNECGAIPAPPFDLVKMWESQLTAALLAGKKVNIGFTACAGFNWIVEVDLLQ